MEKITVTALAQTDVKEKRIRIKSDGRSTVVERGWDHDREGADMAEHAIREAYNVTADQVLTYARSTATGWIFTLR